MKPHKKIPWASIHRENTSKAVELEEKARRGGGGLFLSPCVSLLGPRSYMRFLHALRADWMVFWGYLW